VSKPVQTALERRVLLRTATAKDATITLALLERAGLEGKACAEADELVRELQVGAGALLIAEDALADPGMGGLVTMLRQQPAWSDLPILVVASSGDASTAVLALMDAGANITIVERPLRIVALISAARSALRARSRQYELRALLEGLRLVDQRKTEFLATLAHELRNPLAPLRTALSILTMKEHSAESARPHYEMMGRQINHMVRLIDDLMEVSRITRGKIELKLEIVPLNRVIDEAIELSRPAIDAGRHRLQQTLPAESWFVRGDPVRLTQVFSNLLNNAAKYTPPGGSIEIIAGRHADQVHVHVRDNGVGVPADMLQPMFEMFVQVPDAARTAQGGLGIGLTLVKSLVELHGGSVHARSDGPGRGTDVTVELPLVKAAELPSDPIAYEALQGPLAETVLVVDDNRDAADSLSVLLRAFGARTAVAYSGGAALELMQSLHASIAIVDIGMPGMDGCELAQRLRADPRNADLLLVALTGWGQPGDRVRIKAAGFDHHFLKPLDSDSLISMLRAVRAAPSHAHPPHVRTH